MSLSEWLSVLNFFILTVTLVVLCIYTYDTNRMQKSTAKQVELGIKPLISIVQIEETRGFEVSVTNIGNGTALNIEFSPMILGENIGIEFHIPFIQSLRAGESKNLKVKVLSGGDEADDAWTAHLRPDYANRVIKLSISYENIDFVESTQYFEFGTGERKIKMLRPIK